MPLLPKNDCRVAAPQPVRQNVARCLLVGLISSLTIAALTACVEKKPPVDTELVQAGEELKRSQILVEQKMQDTITAERAKQLASRHLSLKQVRWGDPVAVREDEEFYYVSYETPERELRLIGGRVLLVDKRTGVVQPQKRR